MDAVAVVYCRVMTQEAVVIGAGIQGCCAALELRRLGYHVTLVEASAAAMSRASLRNEGKIHFGFVYGNEPSRATARLMLDAALRFAPLLDRWVGPMDWISLRSEPFTYAVMHDSLVPPAELFAHYDALNDDYLSWRSVGLGEYLGDDPEPFWRPAKQVPAGLGRAPAVAAVAETCERAIDLIAVRKRIVGAIADDTGIVLRLGRRVRTVERGSTGFTVTGHGQDGVAWSAPADVVVNCAWDGRLAIDASLGVVPSRPWVYRLKYRVLGELPTALHGLPSLTFVLGPYGDIVRAAGRATYLSWYPTCMADWSSDLSPPASWSGPCGGDARGAGTEIGRRTLDAFERVVPGMSGFSIAQVDAGVIFAWGSTDIGEADSELHQRNDIGPLHQDGYVTMDTGKLTTAPLFAERLGALLGSPS